MTHLVGIKTGSRLRGIGHLIIIMMFVLNSYPIGADSNRWLSGSLIQQDVNTTTANQRLEIKPTLSHNYIPSRRLDQAENRTRDSSKAMARAHVELKRDEVPSTDCLSKKNQILKRRSERSSANDGPSPSSQHQFQTGQVQRLSFNRERPLESRPTHHLANESFMLELDDLAEGEHVPSCNSLGRYEPIQCHRIGGGYCWCVNKYGNAIKNTAVRTTNEQPYCDERMYESENTDILVVTGTTTERIKKILRPSTSFSDSTTPDGNINFEAEATTEQTTESTGRQRQPNENGSRKSEPTLALIPNDCKNSQSHAKERASTMVNEDIWVPACDMSNDRLYALKQCHRYKASNVCWCVDQVTGLPLITKEPLFDRSPSNCTEIKERVEAMMANAAKQQHQQQQEAFYLGSSEFCDNTRRIEFVISLNNQFRQQISDYIRQSPTNSLPKDLITSDPFNMADSKISQLKFLLMDKDLDGKLGDREWSKFKNNFKLVDKIESVKDRGSYPASSYSGPLMIYRSERKCWRDFLDFCGNGDPTNNESISQTKWVTCTDVPSKLETPDAAGDKTSSMALSENTYANTREAAIIRSKKRNPFMGILKPD